MSGVWSGVGSSAPTLLATFSGPIKEVCVMCVEGEGDRLPPAQVRAVLLLWEEWLAGENQSRSELETEQRGGGREGRDGWPR